MRVEIAAGAAVAVLALGAACGGARELTVVIDARDVSMTGTPQVPDQVDRVEVRLADMDGDPIFATEEWEGSELMGFPLLTTLALDSGTPDAVYLEVVLKKAGAVVGSAEATVSVVAGQPNEVIARPVVE